MATHLPILAVGDMHLADTCWPGRPLFNDTYHVLPQIFNVVKNYNVAKVVFCGDIIDRKRTNSRPIRELRQLIMHIKKHTGDNESALCIQGNHDMSDPPWGEVCGATMLEGKQVTVGDATFTGIDYTPPAELMSKLLGIPRKVNTLFCHQMWKEHKPFGPEPDGSLVDMPLWIKTVISGDIHKECTKTVGRSELGSLKHQKLNCLSFLSPGSTSMQDIVEDEVKHLWLTDGKSFKPVRLRSRHVVRVRRCVTEQNVTDVIRHLTTELDSYAPSPSNNRYAKDVSKPIVDVQYSADLIDFEDRIRTVVADRAHIFFRYFTPEEEQEEFVTSIEWKSQAADAIKKALQEEVDEPEVMELATALLSRRDKTDENLKTFLNRYLETGKCT